MWLLFSIPVYVKNSTENLHLGLVVYHSLLDRFVAPNQTTESVFTITHKHSSHMLNYTRRSVSFKSYLLLISQFSQPTKITFCSQTAMKCVQRSFNVRRDLWSSDQIVKYGLYLCLMTNDNP